MPKFIIEWTEELWYSMEVEGDNREQVLDDFHGGVYDMSNGKNYHVELQDSVTVAEEE